MMQKGEEDEGEERKSRREARESKRTPILQAACSTTRTEGAENGRRYDRVEEGAIS